MDPCFPWVQAAVARFVAVLAEAAKLAAPCVPLSFQPEKLSFPFADLTGVTKRHVKLYRPCSVGMVERGFLMRVSVGHSVPE